MLLIGLPHGLCGTGFACDAEDMGSIAGSGRIPWTEEPGGLQSMGLQSRTRLKWLSTAYSTRATHIL